MPKLTECRLSELEAMFMEPMMLSLILDAKLNTSEDDVMFHCVI